MKMTFPLLCYALLLYGLPLRAQVTFQRTYSSADTTAGTLGNSFSQTADGGYIITGNSNALGTFTGDIFLVKTNARGDTLWARSYSTAGRDIGNDVKQTSDGGYIVTGQIGDTLSHPADIILLKTDANGNVQWNKVFGTANQDIGMSVQQTDDGGYILAGSANGNAVFSDLILIKTDIAGDTLWTKTFGGSSFDEGNSIQQTTDGGFIVLGTAQSFSGNSTTDLYFIKIDSSGTVIWERTIGTPATEFGFAVRETSDGGFVLSGSTDSTYGVNVNIILAKTDAFGNVQWSRNYGDSLFNEYGYSIEQTADGGFITAGHIGQQGASFTRAYLLKTDFLGFPLWAESFNGATSSRSFSVQQSTDGGFTFAGSSWGIGSVQVYLTKTDSTGNSGCNHSTASLPAEGVPITSTNVFSAVSSFSLSISSHALTVQSGSNTNTWCLSVGTVEAPYQNIFQLFPNPALYTISVGIKEAQNKLLLKILNPVGQLVNETVLEPSADQIYTLDISTLPVGIYIIALSNGTSMEFRKFIKI